MIVNTLISASQVSTRSLSGSSSSVTKIPTGPYVPDPRRGEMGDKTWA